MKKKQKNAELDGRTKITDAALKAMRARYAAGFTRGKRNEKFISQKELAAENGIAIRRAVDLLNKKARA